MTPPEVEELLFVLRMLGRGRGREEIHEFWKTHDSADYWEETEPVEIKAERPRQRAVSVKLDERDITQLKRIAKEKGIGHTTLIPMWIKEKLKEQVA